MENKVGEIVKIAFNTDDYKIIKRLIGGRSNYTYVVEIKGDKYTLRIPGKNGNLFVDRNYENYNLNHINRLGINNETVYLDINSGVKISRFIEGETLYNLEYDKYYNQIAELLHKVHKMSKMHNDYDVMGRLAMYEIFCADLKFVHPDEYYELRSKFMSKFSFLSADKTVAAHNDAQPSNYIVGDDNNVYLTDWEFAGNNYPLYDIACFADDNIDQAMELLNVYLGREADNSEIAKVYLWRMFQTLQWFNVAMYKELIGLSKELLVNFEEIANNYLIEASQLYEKAMKYYENK